MPITPPPVDANGAVVVHDHPDIANDDLLIRGITPDHLVSNGKGGTRISSMAYNGTERAQDGMSVDIAKLIIEAGLDSVNFCNKPEWAGTVCFTAGVLRAEQVKVGFDPVRPDNPFHGQAWGDLQSKPRKRRIARAATWHRQIPEVDLI